MYSIYKATQRRSYEKLFKGHGFDLDGDLLHIFRLANNEIVLMTEFSLYKLNSHAFTYEDEEEGRDYYLELSTEYKIERKHNCLFIKCGVARQMRSTYQERPVLFTILIFAIIAIVIFVIFRSKKSSLNRFKLFKNLTFNRAIDKPTKSKSKIKSLSKIQK